MTEDEEDEAFRLEIRGHLVSIRDSYLSMAETNEQVAKDSRKYRKILLGFAQKYRAAADEVSEELREWGEGDHGPDGSSTSPPPEEAPLALRVEDITAAVSPADIEKGMTPKRGFSKVQLAAWGVGWPAPKGWRSTLIENWKQQEARRRYAERNPDGPPPGTAKARFSPKPDDARSHVRFTE